MRTAKLFGDGGPHLFREVIVVDDKDGWPRLIESDGKFYVHDQHGEYTKVVPMKKLELGER